jgi:plastocyanin
MNNVEKIVLVAVILVLVVGGGFIIFAQDNNREPVEKTSSMSHDMSSSSEEVNEKDLVDLTNDSEVKIDIDSTGYKVANIKIKLGSTVVWTNQDTVEHTIMTGNMDDSQSHSTSDDKRELMSPVLKNGESYSYTFNEVGNYSYHCSKHPSEKANVTVVH